MDDASRAESELADADKQYKNILLDTRLNNRVLDLLVSRYQHFHALLSVCMTVRHSSQTTTNQAIFKLQAAITDGFQTFLKSQGFTEIHTPKLQSSATESGASVFKVSYFKGMSLCLPLVICF